MDAANKIDRGDDNNDNANTDVTHAAATSIITSGLYSVNKFTSVPDLSDDELVTLQLKNKKKNSNFVLVLKFPKGKRNENNFEECKS